MLEVMKKKQKLNLLFLSSTGLSSLSGGGWTRIAGEAKIAKKAGLSIKLLCFVPIHVLLFKPRFAFSARSNLIVQSGCSVIFIPLLPFGRFKHIYTINTILGQAFVFLVSFWHNVSCIHIHGVGNFPYVWFSKLVLKVKVIVDVHGAIVEEYKYENKLIDKKIFSRLENVERKALCGADKVVFVSKSMFHYYYEKFGVDFKKSLIIPCATSLGSDISLTKRNFIRNQLDLEGKFVLCYLGSCESYQMPFEMCKLFLLISKHFSSAHFLVISGHKKLFEKYINDLGISPEQYTIFSVDHEKVFEILPAADVGFLLRRDSIVNRVASPTKFAEYLLCGVPVLTTTFVGDFSHMVEKFNIGLTVGTISNNVESSLIRFLMDVQKNRELYFYRCSSFAKNNLLWDSYKGQIVKLYKN